jgi:hypothetical protein
MMQAASGCFSSAKFSCKFVGSANKSAARSPMAAGLTKTALPGGTPFVDH